MNTLKSNLLIASLVLFALTNSFAQPCKEIVGYYPSWQWYDRAQLVNPSTINYSKYTIINYAFFVPKPDGKIDGFDVWADEQLLLGKTDWVNGGYLPNTSLVDLAHNNNVKVLISVGGWTLSTEFPQIAASAGKRAVFAGACRQLVQKYKLDGIDIDWEYPGYTPHGGTAADKQNFTLFLQQIKDSLSAYTVVTGKSYLLTAAVGASPANASNVEWNNVKNILDMINLMTYDFFGAWDSKANHNAPLYAPTQGDPSFNVQAAYTMFTQTYNIPGSKLNIGLGFYGRSQTGATALHQATNGGENTTLFSDDAGVPQYFNVMKYLNLFDYYWDNTAKVPYLLGKTGGTAAGTFVSYDNKESIAEKAKFINTHGARGAIVWEITGDFMEASPGSGIIASTPLADTLNYILCSNLILGVNNDEKNINSAVVFPNPSYGDINIVFHSLNNEESAIEIYNTLGDLIQKQNVSALKGVNTFHLSILKPGFYIAVIKGQNTASKVKFTVAE